MSFIRDPSELWVDIQRIILLQVRDRFPIQWNSYGCITEFYGPNLCFRFRPNQRIADDLASNHSTPDTNRILKLYSEQFHGDF